MAARDQTRWVPADRPQGRQAGPSLYRFPLIVEALAQLRPRSITVDGEGVACDDTGVRTSNAFDTTIMMTTGLSSAPSI